MRTRLLSVQFGLFLIIAMLISSVQSVVFDHSFYINLYETTDLASQIGVSEEDLQKSIFVMTDYAEGKREDMEGTIVRYGEEVPIFNAKEKKHMKDVCTLWLSAKGVMIFSWIAAALAAGILLAKKKTAGVYDLISGFFAALMTLLVLLLILGMWGMIDFGGFWFWFHTIVFPGNSDWLLNPATDFMIVICPEIMFSSMITQIALRLLAGLGILAVIGIVLARSDGRKAEALIAKEEVYEKTDTGKQVSPPPAAA